ncbi:MAG: hypothetical protein AABY22_12245 [Nanoarchaeota archaeon]
MKIREKKNGVAANKPATPKNTESNTSNCNDSVLNKQQKQEGGKNE